MTRDVFPPSNDAFAVLVQPYLPVHDFPKQARPVLHADGDEIRPGLRVVVALQADAAAVMTLRVVRHNPRSFKNRSASFTRNSPEISLGSSVSRSAARVLDSVSASSIRRFRWPPWGKATGSTASCGRGNFPGQRPYRCKQDRKSVV